MLTRRRVIAAKVEGTEGTMEAITVADAGILAIDPKVEFDFAMNERSNMLNTLSKLVPVPGKQSAKVSFRAEMKGPGASYSASVKPALGVYLRACGFAETVVAATSVTYAPASSGVPSLTIWVYEDGIVKKMKGCRGNAKIAGKVGEICYIDFEFTGVFDSVADLAMISPTFEASVPPVLQGTTFTVDGYAGIISSAEINMGNTLQLRESATATSGHLSCLITDRRPVGKLDPEMVTVATYDFFGKWKNGTAGALVLGAVGGTAFNRFTITAPKVVYTKVGEGERTGLMVADLDFALAMNTGDDEISIAFT